jgi:hypothetical protein
MKVMYQDLDTPDRLLQIKAEAVRSELVFFQKQLSDEEINELQTKLVEASLQIAQVEEEKSSVVEQFSLQLKPLKLAVKHCIELLSNRSQRVQEQVYLVPDYKKKTMTYVAEDGYVVSQRPLLPEERQLTIHSQSNLKAAANDE